MDAPFSESVVTNGVTSDVGSSATSGVADGVSISVAHRLSNSSLDRRGFLRRIAAIGSATVAMGTACAMHRGGAEDQLGARVQPGAQVRVGTQDPSDAQDPSSAQDPVAAPPKAARKAVPFKLSLAEWSFHRALYSGKLGHLDFAAQANELGIDAVEYVNVFFKDRARDKAYLGEMKKRCRENGMQSLLIMIDDEGDLGDPDEKTRLRAVEDHGRWAEAAAYLGCHSIRVNTENSPWEARAPSRTPEEQAKLVADGLRRLCEFVDPLGIDVLVENHGGLSSDGRWVKRLLEIVAHPRSGTLPDFGNFDLGGGKTYDRYRGVREMMPRARAVSAKSYDFDGRGDETRIDFRKMMKIVTEAGYHGHVGIEYEGDRLGEEEGVRKTRDLLLEVRRELSPA